MVFSEDGLEEKFTKKMTRLMGNYTEEFKEELLGYNLVVRGLCTVSELRTTMTYEDVIKCNEALLIKSELERIE